LHVVFQDHVINRFENKHFTPTTVFLMQARVSRCGYMYVCLRVFVYVYFLFDCVVVTLALVASVCK